MVRRDVPGAPVLTGSHHLGAPGGRALPNSVQQSGDFHLPLFGNAPNRSGSLFLLVVGIAGVIGILALAFSRLSREIHADVFRFLRREVCEQVLSSALEEAWSNLSFRGTTPDTPEYSWITESEKRKTRLSIEVPLTTAEAGFLSHDHPNLRPEDLEVSASLVDFRETDSKKRPYFPGEGVGTLALEAKCRVAGESMRRARTHDVKIVTLLSPSDRDRQNTYSQNGILDYTLFVRNATRDFIEVSIDGSPPVFKISFDAGAPPDRCGEVFIGTSDGAVEKKFKGNPGFFAECSLGTFPNLQDLTSSRPRLRDFEGNEINNLNISPERGIQPFRHLNLAGKRIAVSPDSPDGTLDISEALQEAGILDLNEGVLNLQGIIQIQGGILDLGKPGGNRPSMDGGVPGAPKPANRPDGEAFAGLSVRGRGILVADEIIVSSGLKNDDSFPGGSLLVLCSTKGPITVRTGESIEAALVALSWKSEKTGRLVLSPGVRLNLKGLLAVDELGIGRWTQGVSHSLIDDPRFHREASAKALFSVYLSHAVSWQQTKRED